MHIACENGHQDIVFLLMSNNANLEARDSVSDYLCEMPFLLFLIFYSIDGQERKTPLHLVCGKGHEDIVFLLLAKNANLEARDSVSDLIVLSYFGLFLILCIFNRMEKLPCILHVKRGIRILYLFCCLTMPIWKSEIL